MKKIFVLLVVAGAATYFWRQHKQAEDLNPSEILNPVYAEARVKIEIQGRSIDAVMFIKTLDQADCQAQSQLVERYLKEGMGRVCSACKLQQSECKTELPSRYAKLFNNQPAALTYLSLPRGNQAEREIRLIYWGVSTEESDRLCDVVQEFQKGRKGLVSCVRR